MIIDNEFNLLLTNNPEYKVGQTWYKVTGQFCLVSVRYMRNWFSIKKGKGNSRQNGLLDRTKKGESSYVEIPLKVEGQNGW